MTVYQNCVQQTSVTDFFSTQKCQLFHVIQAKENKLQLWLNPQSQHFSFTLFFLLFSVPAGCGCCCTYCKFLCIRALTQWSLFPSSLQKYVREQILLAVAVIVKRGSLDKSINCKSIFHEVGQLISSGNTTVVRKCSFFLFIYFNVHLYRDKYVA